MDAPKRLTRELYREFAHSPMAFFRQLKVPEADPSKRFDEVWGGFQEEAFEEISPCLMAVATDQMPPYRGVWLERTKGASKDSDVACCLLWLAFFSRRPLDMEMGAEKEEQAAETTKAMEDIVELNPWMKPHITFFKTRVFAKRTRVEMDVLATTRTAAHGSRPHVSLINELSHIVTKKFAETMQDNATKLANNFMLIATNAGELHSWQYDWREELRRNKTWWFQKVEEIAPWIPERNIETARGLSTPMRFNRLWKGIWSPREGDAIDPVDIDRAIRLTGPMTTEEIKRDGWLVILGGDAGIKHDHAALIALAVKPGQPEIRLARCESWAPGPNQKIDLTLMDAAIARAHRDFLLLGMCYDVTQMELMAQRAAKIGVPIDPINFTGREADEMVRVILECFRNGRIAIFPDEMLIRDLHRLVIKENRFGHYKLDAIRDEYGHADRAIALAIALPAAVLVAMQEPPGEDEGAEHRIET